MNYRRPGIFFQAFFLKENSMYNFLVVFIGLFLISNSVAMEQIALQVVAADMVEKSANHTTYTGLTLDNQKIEIEVCTKMRKTRNANPYELHFSGRIGKKRLKRADARKLVNTLIEAKKFTYVHPAALRPVKIEKN
jgi:hypothetical protein